MLHAPYEGTCECAEFNILSRLSGSLSSGIVPSVSKVMSSFDVSFDVTEVSGINSVDEDNSMIFKAYRGHLPNNPC